MQLYAKDADNDNVNDNDNVPDNVNGNEKENENANAPKKIYLKKGKKVFHTQKGEFSTEKCGKRLG